jgi:hypothetical protein
MPTPLEIVRGVSQAAANAYDGALDPDGNPIEIGLKREEGHLVKDSRLVDGFKIKFHGPVLRIVYQCDVKLKEVYANGFESDILTTINSAANFLKKEYKRVTGDTLALTKLDGEYDMMVQQTSRVRSFVNAHCDYKVGGMEGVLEVGEDERERTVDDAIKGWLGMNGNLKRATGTGLLGNTTHPNSKGADNVTGKRDLEPK